MQYEAVIRSCHLIGAVLIPILSSQLASISGAFMIEICSHVYYNRLKFQWNLSRPVRSATWANVFRYITMYVEYGSYVELKSQEDGIWMAFYYSCKDLKQPIVLCFMKWKYILSDMLITRCYDAEVWILPRSVVVCISERSLNMRIACRSLITVIWYGGF